MLNFRRPTLFLSLFKFVNSFYVPYSACLYGYPNGRWVPEAEVNIGILDVC